MEIKINLDELFGGSQDNGYSQQQSSYPSVKDSPTIHGSLDNSFDYAFNFNSKIFDTPEAQYHQEVEDFKEYSEIEPSIKSLKTIKSVNSSNSNKSKTPGERLYYESQLKQLRKNCEKQKVNEEAIAEHKRTNTFAPQINQNSRKLAQKIKNKPKQTRKPMKMQQKPTVAIKEQQELKQCTFQPKIITKNTNTNVKSKEQFFYYLHNTSKIKEAQLNLMIQNQYAKYRQLNKKASQTDFLNFLKRNEEYTSIIKKKQEMVRQNSAKYDLKTGDKLFSPKFIQSKAFNHHSVFSAKDLKKDAFLKKYERNQIKQQTQRIKKHQQKNSAYKNQSAKPKSGIFSKKRDLENQINSLKHSYEVQSHEQIRELPEDNELEMQRQYQLYLQQFQQEGKVNIHNEEPIYQQYNESNDDVKKPEKSRSNANNSQQVRVKGNNFNLGRYEDGSISYINEEEPLDINNVHQFLNSSQENQNVEQYRRNDVMDILNHLLIKQEDEV